MSEDSPDASHRGAMQPTRRNSASGLKRNSNLLELSDISSTPKSNTPVNGVATSGPSFDPFDLRATTSASAAPPILPPPQASDSFDPLGALLPLMDPISPQRPESSGPSDPWAALVSKQVPPPSSSKRPPLHSGPSSSKGTDLFSLLHETSNGSTSSSRPATSPLPPPTAPSAGLPRASSRHDDLDDLLAFTSVQVTPRSRSASDAGGGAGRQRNGNNEVGLIVEGPLGGGLGLHHSGSEGKLTATSGEDSKTAREAAKAAAAAVASSSLADVPDHSPSQPRELLIYAIPLMKDKLVFLPVTAFEFGKDEDEADLLPQQQQQGQGQGSQGQGSQGQGSQGEGVEEQRESPSGRPAVPVTTVIGRGIMSSLTSVQTTMSGWWTNMKEANPGTFKRHVHDAASAIVENMTAEERLMKNIPRHANKLIVYHPACIDPIHVQEQLNTMTSSFCVRSMGKAAVAGTLLPVAVGIEILAVPGIGWYALYQLYKSSVATAGGLRLKSYLAHGGGGENIVRVNYAAEPKLDLYVERAALSPDGILTNDDVDDLCFDLKEPDLYHNLLELRKRYIARHVKAKSAKDGNADYALLPVMEDSTGNRRP